MDGYTLPTTTMLPTVATMPGPKPDSAGKDATWDVVHTGTADTPDHGAQALMRTSDGYFRISADDVDGKVGLKIERLHLQHISDETDGVHTADASARR